MFKLFTQIVFDKDEKVDKQFLNNEIENAKGQFFWSVRV